MKVFLILCLLCTLNSDITSFIGCLVTSESIKNFIYDSFAKMISLDNNSFVKLMTEIISNFTSPFMSDLISCATKEFLPFPFK